MNFGRYPGPPAAVKTLLKSSIFLFVCLLSLPSSTGTSHDFRFRRSRFSRRRWRGACRRVPRLGSETDSTRRAAGATMTARPGEPSPRPGRAGRGSRGRRRQTRSTPLDAIRRRPAALSRGGGFGGRRDLGSRSKRAGPSGMEWSTELSQRPIARGGRVIGHPSTGMEWMCDGTTVGEVTHDSR